MKRKDYKNFVWYPLTDEEYWVDNNENFPNCQTIICCTNPEICEKILTRNTAFIGWSTMAKYEEWMFMIIEKL